MERLGDVVVRADLETDGALDRVALAGQDHHPDLRLLAQKPGQAEAVLPWHADVDQHEIDRLAAHDAAKGGSAIGGGHPKPLAREIGGEPAPQQRVVIDYDNMLRQ
jgi:hypothetical protein